MMVDAVALTHEYASASGEAPYEPLTRVTAGIDTGLPNHETGRFAHRRDLL